MAKRRIIPARKLTSVDDLLDRADAINQMSSGQLSKFVKNALARASKTKLSDDDVVMIMAEDGYFQNEDGEFV